MIFSVEFPCKTCNHKVKKVNGFAQVKHEILYKTAMLLTSKCKTGGHHNSLNTVIDSVAKMVVNLWTVKVDGPKKANWISIFQRENFPTFIHFCSHDSRNASLRLHFTLPRKLLQYAWLFPVYFSTFRGNP